MLQGTLTGITSVLLIIAIVIVVLLWWRRGWFIQWLKGTLGFVLVLLTVAGVFALVDLWSYRQLLQEQPLL